jgi:hypothetical protein
MISGRIEEVVAATEERPTTSEQISPNIESISTVSQQNAKATHDFAKAIEELEEATADAHRRTEPAPDLGTGGGRAEFVCGIAKQKESSLLILLDLEETLSPGEVESLRGMTETEAKDVTAEAAGEMKEEEELSRKKRSSAPPHLRGRVPCEKTFICGAPGKTCAWARRVGTIRESSDRTPDL